MPSLNGAVSLIEVDDIAIFVAWGGREGDRERDVGEAEQRKNHLSEEKVQLKFT